MTSRISEWVIDCHDADRLAQFWCEVLGYREVDRSETEVEIAGLPGEPSILFQQVPEDKTVKNRLHLDLNAIDDDQHLELGRILAAGATRIDIGQGDPSWVVLADPEGNEFCLLRRTVEAAPAPLRDA